MENNKPLNYASLRSGLRKFIGRPEDPYRKYINSKWRVFAIGNIADSGYAELYAILNGRQKGLTLFNEDFVTTIGLDADGKKIFEGALTRVCILLKKLLGAKYGKESRFYPWRWAVAIAPTLEVNASVRISTELKKNTALIVLNAGVLLENLNRLHAYSSVAGFSDAFQDSLQTMSPSYSAAPGYLLRRSSDPETRAMASEIAVKATMMIVFHEVAHFLRGHLAYLQVEKYPKDQPVELSAAESIGKSKLPFSERRLLELDADEACGRLSAGFWRDLDHPVAGSMADKNERFIIEIIFAVLSNHIIFESLLQTEKYYSPIWRTQHILQNYWRIHFSLDSTDGEYAKEWDEIDNQMFSLQIKVGKYIERVCDALGWAGVNCFDNFAVEAKTLLESDKIALEELRNHLQEFMPLKFSFR